MRMRKPVQVQDYEKDEELQHCNRLDPIENRHVSRDTHFGTKVAKLLFYEN